MIKNVSSMIEIQKWINMNIRKGNSPYKETEREKKQRHDHLISNRKGL